MSGTQLSTSVFPMEGYPAGVPEFTKVICLVSTLLYTEFPGGQGPFVSFTVSTWCLS